MASEITLNLSSQSDRTFHVLSLYISSILLEIVDLLLEFVHSHLQGADVVVSLSDAVGSHVDLFLGSLQIHVADVQRVPDNKIQNHQIKNRRNIFSCLLWCERFLFCVCVCKINILVVLNLHDHESLLHKRSY